MIINTTPPTFTAPMPTRAQVQQLSSTLADASRTLEASTAPTGGIYEADAAKGAGLLRAGGMVLMGLAPQFGMLGNQLVSSASTVLAHLEAKDYDAAAHAADAAAGEAMTARGAIAALPTSD